MTKLTIIVRYIGEKHTVPTQSDIVLEDLLQQLSDRGVLPNHTFVATKYGTETALDLGATLEENGIQDNDVIDLALPTKAGASLAF